MSSIENKNHQLPPIQVALSDVYYYVTPPPLTSPSPKKPIKSPSRKLSHKAFEKRRREEMNDKIERLKELIPACTQSFPISVQQPMQKLSVLQAAIDYIQELHTQLHNNLPEDDPLLSTILPQQKPS